MMQFVKRYAIVIVALVLALLAITIIGIQAVLAYKINSDSGFLYIWLGGVILMNIGLYHPIKLLIENHKAWDES